MGNRNRTRKKNNSNKKIERKNKNEQTSNELTSNGPISNEATSSEKTSNIPDAFKMKEVQSFFEELKNIVWIKDEYAFEISEIWEDGTFPFNKTQARPYAVVKNGTKKYYIPLTTTIRLESDNSKQIKDKEGNAIACMSIVFYLENIDENEIRKLPINAQELSQERYELLLTEDDWIGDHTKEILSAINKVKETEKNTPAKQLSSLKSLKRALNILQEKHDMVLKENAEKTAELAKKNAELDKMRKQRDKANKEHAETNEKLAKTTAELAETNEKLAKTTAERDKTNEKLAEANEKIAKMRKVLTEVNEQNQQLLEDKRILQDNVKKLHNKGTDNQVEGHRQSSSDTKNNNQLNNDVQPVVTRPVKQGKKNEKKSGNQVEKPRHPSSVAKNNNQLNNDVQPVVTTPVEQFALRNLEIKEIESFYTHQATIENCFNQNQPIPSEVMVTNNKLFNSIKNKLCSASENIESYIRNQGIEKISISNYPELESKLLSLSYLDEKIRILYIKINNIVSIEEIKRDVDIINKKYETYITRLDENISPTRNFENYFRAINKYFQMPYKAHTKFFEFYKKFKTNNDEKNADIFKCNVPVFEKYVNILEHIEKIKDNLYEKKVNEVDIKNQLNNILKMIIDALAPIFMKIHPFLEEDSAKNILRNDILPLYESSDQKFIEPVINCAYYPKDKDANEKQFREELKTLKGEANNLINNKSDIIKYCENQLNEDDLYKEIKAQLMKIHPFLNDEDAKRTINDIILPIYKLNKKPPFDDVANFIIKKPKQPLTRENFFNIIIKRALIAFTNSIYNYCKNPNGMEKELNAASDMLTAVNPSLDKDDAIDIIKQFVPIYKIVPRPDLYLTNCVYPAKDSKEIILHKLNVHLFRIYIDNYCKNPNEMEEVLNAASDMLTAVNPSLNKDDAINIIEKFIPIYNINRINPRWFSDLKEDVYNSKDSKTIILNKFNENVFNTYIDRCCKNPNGIEKELNVLSDILKEVSPSLDKNDAIDMIKNEILPICTKSSLLIKAIFKCVYKPNITKEALYSAIDNIKEFAPIIIRQQQQLQQKYTGTPYKNENNRPITTQNKKGTTSLFIK